MMKYLKNFLKGIVILTITFAILEISAFFLLKFDSTELFSLRNFTEKTDDKRFYTLKKNYSSEELDHFYGGRTFLITTSNERVRISNKNDVNTNFLNPTNMNEKILFLGDSVTFGWGVDVEESFPFLFKKYNKELSVINGAIPGYSLAQSIERFKIEFLDIKNLKFIYIQNYSPAPSYARLGTFWSENDNWANFPEQVLKTLNIRRVEIPFYGEPLSYNFFRKKMYRIKHKKIKETLYSEESDIKFINHINSNLEKLYSFAKNKNSILILSSITVPKFSAENRTDSHERAISLLNNTLYNFSLNKDDVHHFDMISKLNVNSEKMFVDFCCHLSKHGADLMALELTKLIKKID